MKTIMPEPFTDLTDLFRQNRCNTRFVLKAGKYTCQSLRSFQDLDWCVLGNDCELIGAGSDATSIEMEDPSEDQVSPSQIEWLTAGSRLGNSHYSTVMGLTVIIPIYYPEPKAVTGHVGVHIWSDRCQVGDLRILNVSGAREKSGAPSSEGFGLLVNQSGVPAVVGGSEINGVRVFNAITKRDENYVCAVYVGYKTPKLRSNLRNVEIANTGTKPAHAALGVNGMVSASGIRASGKWNRGIYCDVTGGSCTTISDSDFEVERVGIEFRGGADVRWENITVSGSRFRIAPRGGAYGALLVLADDSQAKNAAEFESVVASGCVVYCDPDPSTATDFYTGSLDSSKVSRCGLHQCLFVGPGGDGVKPAPVSKLSAKSKFFVR